MQFLLTTRTSKNFEMLTNLPKDTVTFKPPPQKPVGFTFQRVGVIGNAFSVQNIADL